MARTGAGVAGGSEKWLGYQCILEAELTGLWGRRKLVASTQL